MGKPSTRVFRGEKDGLHISCLDKCSWCAEITVSSLLSLYHLPTDNIEQTIFQAVVFYLSRHTIVMKPNLMCVPSLETVKHSMGVVQQPKEFKGNPMPFLEAQNGDHSSKSWITLNPVFLGHLPTALPSPAPGLNIRPLCQGEVRGKLT